MATGIRDKVAIVGMGCTRFGERWDVGADGLMVEAFAEALADAGMERARIEAAWVGNALDDINVGNSALPAAHALRLDKVAVTRVENMCATGTEALRGAAYAVASGAVDVALAIGVGAMVNALWLLIGLLRNRTYIPQPGWGRFALQVLAASALLAVFLMWSSASLPWLAMKAEKLKRMGWLALVVSSGVAIYFIAIWAAGLKLRQFMRR